jgi:flagellar basal body-associated protein FliL
MRFSLQEEEDEERLSLELLLLLLLLILGLVLKATATVGFPLFSPGEEERGKAGETGTACGGMENSDAENSDKLLFKCNRLA